MNIGPTSTSQCHFYAGEKCFPLLTLQTRPAACQHRQVPSSRYDKIKTLMTHVNNFRPYLNLTFVFKL